MSIIFIMFLISYMLIIIIYYNYKPWDRKLQQHLIWVSLNWDYMLKSHSSV
jgi:hypothetical protein